MMMKLLIAKHVAWALCRTCFHEKRGSLLRAEHERAANQTQATAQPIPPGNIEGARASAATIDELEADLRSQKTAQASTETAGW